MPRFRHYRATGIIGFAALLCAAPVWAQEAETIPSTEPAEDANRERAAAEVLFEAGRVAMDAGDFDTACQKFEASLELDPAPGTLMNLGNCEEKRGRVASAWERYVAAQRELTEADRRYAFVQTKIAELDPKVPRLTIVLADEAPEATEVRRDATNLTGSLGVPLPLDPGTYAIEALAEGHEPRTFEVELELGESRELEVAPGEPLSAGPGPEDGEPHRFGPLTQRQWGYVVGGVGVVGVATALTAGGFAYREARTMDDHCDPQTRLCDAVGMDARETGGTLARVADIAGVVGVLGVGAGLALILTDGGSSEASQQGAAPGPRFSARVEFASAPGFQAVRLKGAFW